MRCTDDITEMAFLLFACLYHAIILIPSDVQCDLIDSKCNQLRLACISYQIKCKHYIHTYILTQKVAAGIKSNDDVKKESKAEEKMAKIEERVFDHLCTAVKAHESRSQVECMIDYVRDMLLKVSRRRGRGWERVSSPPSFISFHLI